MVIINELTKEQEKEIGKEEEETKNTTNLFVWFATQHIKQSLQK